ncbi:peptidase A24 [Curtobacterium oceanosedimentum]|uniref:Prepilin leader peptidase/N-methyltransferase n=1 Tax=Curtobacterium oceanosedimentum TaxID=465820 RepID=A0ABR5S7D1_9MICO|nr:peptidase A24 [Curtobacterium oceanosedimentum]
MVIGVPPVLLLAVLSGGVGLLIGSFLNVVIHRVPAGLSVVRPRSACPTCHTPIRPRDNVPVLSWVVLGGRCRDCRTSISPRYPLVELATGLLFAVVAWGAVAAPPISSDGTAGLPVVLAFLYLMAISVALTMIDLDVHRLPDRIVLPAYPVLLVLFALGSALSGDWVAFLRGLAGMAALAASYLLLAVLVPGGMGFGDVKLAGVLGLALAYLGWGPLAVGSFAAFLLGGTFALVLVATRRAGRRSGIPFGPWMVCGAWVGVLFGADLWNAYLALLGIG